MSPEPAYAEFVFRVHADGRRERSATVYVRLEDGTLVTATGTLSGAVGEFAADAVAEAMHLDRGTRRRVVIDERTTSYGRRR